MPNAAPTWQHAAQHLIALHQQGKIQLAITQGLQLIQQYPDNAFLLYLVGSLHGEIGQDQTGVPYIKQAIALSPKVADYHYMLGMLYGRLKQRDHAITAYQNALKYNSKMTTALNNLGILYHEQGDHKHAIECYQKVLSLDLNKVDSHNNLGNVYKDKYLFLEAKECYRRAIKIDPSYANAYCNLGIIYYYSGEFNKAIVALKKAQELAPDLSQIYHNLVLSFTAVGNYSQAKVTLEKEFSLTHDPINKKLELNIIACHQNDYTSAKKYCSELYKMAPNNIRVILTYGVFLIDTNQIKQAIDVFRRAIELEPNNAEAHLYLALSLLSIGEFAEGWHEFDWRWKMTSLSMILKEYPTPLWDGKIISDQTLLIYTEQGIGDSLQFLRFLTEIKPKVGQLIVECEPVLIDLVKRIPDVDQVISKAEKTIPKHDVHLPLMKLGHILQLTNDNVTRPTPYLTVDQQKQQHWKTTFAKQSNKKKIGLVWAGNPQHKNDYKRSMPYHYLEPLLKQSHCQFYSLLKLLITREPYVLPKDTPIIDLNPQLHTFDDTAAIISQLDLVISVDTATAHLAGALGKPVWLLLPFSADWRWGLERTDSPWYPSARLFRQNQPGDWQSVIEKVVKEILTT